MAAGWRGGLETGSGLVVWPCHDIATDFDGERIDDEWELVSGSIDLLDPIPAVGDDDGAGTVRAYLREAVFQRSDGTQVTVEDVDLVSSNWGFAGG
ncbi:MAG: hypothetical protein ACRBI6_01070 [Acidimicrobiales bacterium]